MTEDVAPIADSPLDFSAALADRDKKPRKKRTTRTPKVAVQDIADTLYSLGTLINGGVKSVKDWAADALTDDELVALVEALTMEVQASPRALRWFQNIGKVSPHLALAQVSIVIIARRLVRRGVLPEGTTDALTRSDTAPGDVETGRAYSDSGINWNGQDNASIEDIPTSPLYVSPQV